MIDIIEVKGELKSGKLKITYDDFGDLFLEDTVSGECVKIDSIPAVHAYWEVRKSWNGCTPDLDVCCSNCGHEYGCTDWNYCPNCGAIMDEEVK